jgi:MFS family permease
MAGSSPSFRTFLVVWSGQFVSLVGSGLTGFAVAVWVYQETGSATMLALTALAFVVPSLVVTPIAGALVDRWDRRWAMVFSDAGAGLGTVVVWLLLATGYLEVWHLFLTNAFSSVFGSFQWPAYSAATTLLVPKAHYGRAAGLVQLARAIGQVVTPVLAGALLFTIGLEGVLVIDVSTFLFAVATLLLVRFPHPERSPAGEEGQGSLRSEARFGFRYIRQRHGLLALLVYFFGVNILLGFFNVLLFPLVLSLTNEAAAGGVFSVAAIGSIVGGLVMSAWGGPQRRIKGVIGGVAGVFVALILLGSREALVVVGIALFMLNLVIPVATGSSQAIWQSKVDPDVQGRVFAVRRVFGDVGEPLSMLAAGPLADHVFEPMLATDGAMAGSVGRLIGTGPGRGVGFLFILLGILGILGTIVAWSYRPLRNLEDEIPDAVRDDSQRPESEHGPVVEEGAFADPAEHPAIE